MARMRFRTGRTVGRTIYLHDGDDPDGMLVGTLDTRALAIFAAESMNAALDRRDVDEDALLLEPAPGHVVDDPEPDPPQQDRPAAPRWAQLADMLIAGLARLVALGLLVSAGAHRPVRWDLALYAAAALVFAMPVGRSR